MQAFLTPIYVDWALCISHLGKPFFFSENRSFGKKRALHFLKAVSEKTIEVNDEVECAAETAQAMIKKAKDKESTTSKAGRVISTIQYIRSCAASANNKDPSEFDKTVEAAEPAETAETSDVPEVLDTVLDVLDFIVML